MLFTYKFFYVHHSSLTLLILASIGFLVEQTQGFFPHNLRFGRIHTIGAYLMGLFMILILVLAPSVVHLSTDWLVAYMGLTFIYLLAGLYAYFNRLKFYQAQLVFFSVFYLFLVVLLYGGK